MVGQRGVGGQSRGLGIGDADLATLCRKKPVLSSVIGLNGLVGYCNIVSYVLRMQRCIDLERDLPNEHLTLADRCMSWTDKVGRCFRLDKRKEDVRLNAVVATCHIVPFSHTTTKYCTLPPKPKINTRIRPASCPVHTARSTRTAP